MSLYHRIFQETGITPDEYDEKPLWVQRFIAASVKLTIEERRGGGLSGGHGTHRNRG